jgi:hypothetical protein
MVRKKLEPFIEVVGKGPQMSQCIKSKEKQVTELLCTKGNLCCLARGQTNSSVIGITRDRWNKVMQQIYS